MKKIRFKFSKKGKCENCREKEEDLYLIKNGGKVKLFCEACILGWAMNYNKTPIEKEDGKDLILQL